MIGGLIFGICFAVLDYCPGTTSTANRILSIRSIKNESLFFNTVKEFDFIKVHIYDIGWNEPMEAKNCQQQNKAIQK